MKTKRKKPKTVADPELDSLESQFLTVKGVQFMEWVEKQLKNLRASLIGKEDDRRLVALRTMAAKRGKAWQYDAMRERMTEAIESCEECEGDGTVDCSTCDGTGDCECECGHSHECSSCDGSGIQTCQACRL